MTEQQVLKSITRDQLKELAKSLGLEPSTVLSIRIEPTYIYVETLVRDSDGVMMTDGKDLLRKMQVIRVKDDTDE